MHPAALDLRAFVSKICTELRHASAGARRELEKTRKLLARAQAKAAARCALLARDSIRDAASRVSDGIGSNLLADRAGIQVVASFVVQVTASVVLDYATDFQDPCKSESGALSRSWPILSAEPSSGQDMAEPAC